VEDDNTASVNMIKVVNGSEVTQQPASQKNKNKRNVGLDQKKQDTQDTQDMQMVRHTVAIPVKKAKDPILVPKMTTEVQQELRAARVFVEKNRTINDKIFDPDISNITAYSNDHFRDLRFLKKKLKPTTFYVEHQFECYWNARSRLMDWLVRVHDNLDLVHEILYLAVNCVDRYLLPDEVRDHGMKLIGAASLSIATEHVDNRLGHGEPGDRADGAFTSNQLRDAEHLMLRKLDSALEWPEPMIFLRRISRVDEREPNAGDMSEYFLYITAVDKHFLGCVPSFLSAGAYCLRRFMLEKGPWVILCLLLVIGMLTEYSRNATYITLVTH
jgi:G2/mitotic-specific cyclin 3/4